MVLQKIYVKSKKECTSNNFFQYCNLFLTNVYTCMYVCMYTVVRVLFAVKIFSQMSQTAKIKHMKIFHDQDLETTQIIGFVHVVVIVCFGNVSVWKHG